jgi:hypothetical protein
MAFAKSSGVTTPSSWVGTDDLDPVALRPHSGGDLQKLRVGDEHLVPGARAGRSPRCSGRARCFDERDTRRVRVDQARGSAAGAGTSSMAM